MKKQLSVVDLIAAIQAVVKKNTGVDCLDHVDVNQPSPFYFVEFAGNTPANTKNIYCNDYNVNIHCIAEESSSSVPVLKMIRNLEESLTEDITLPDEFNLVYQESNGTTQIFTEETGEKHAVVSMTFRVSYGYMCK
ncbi:MAG: DUF5072 family protein [Erysipelotrichaceae bacterium]|nr:DUF5072 family protein [Erysipelotrichaceae bacterium]